MLSGGFQQNLVYLLLGDKKITTNILLTTSVIVQKTFDNGGLRESVRVTFIDGNNRFNRYNVSKFAVTQNLSPRMVLENILISRAFTYEQMLGISDNRISILEDVKVVLISGITTSLENYEEYVFEELLQVIKRIRNILQKIKPLIIITAPMHEDPHFRLRGSRLISQAEIVLVMIIDRDNIVEYSLIQHPHLPEKRVIKWKPRTPKKKPPLKNVSLDNWL